MASDKERCLHDVMTKIEAGHYYLIRREDAEEAKSGVQAICGRFPEVTIQVTDLINLLDSAGEQQHQMLLKKKPNGIDQYKRLISFNQKKQKMHHEKEKSTYEERRVSNEKEVIQRKDMEINELKSRLSKVAGESLRDNNPSITDLSDANRPTKLAEYFAELYNNEWTDAYSVLSKRHHQGEEFIIKKLLKLLMRVYEFSLHYAAIHRRKLSENLVYPFGIEKTLEANVEEGVEKRLRAKVKQIQKETGIYALPAVREQNNSNDFRENGYTDSKEIMQFIDKSLDICWMFAIQDPPMHIYVEKENETLSQHVREYTKRGQTVKFNVWPTLYLHKGGPVMCKGIVQPN